MLSAKDIRDVTFSKQVGGYRREEVDVFLDKVESDYKTYEHTLQEMNTKIHDLESQIAESKNSEGSIQSVLISAQKLADKIVAEAKEKSSAIIEEAKMSLENFKSHEKELSGAFDKKAEERKQRAREQLDIIIDEAKVNRDKISSATKLAVEKQTELFNRLKLETAAFKAEIMDKYKKHLEMLSKIPDSIPTNPEEIAKAVDMGVDDLSDREKFIEELGINKSSQKPQEIADIPETVISEPEEEPEVQINKSEGFTVSGFDSIEDDE